MAERSPGVAVARVGPDQWDAGVRVVVEAQAATGVPAHLPPEQIPAWIGARQQAACGVWLACATDGVASPVAVGHALVEPVGSDHEAWPGVPHPQVQAALAEGRLVALGGLAVSPRHAHRGVATALVAARLVWAASQPGLVVVASVWHASPGSLALARRFGHVVAEHPRLPTSLFLYDLPMHLSETRGSD